MKKNLLPLLGIAFLVALAATGIFYGLVSSQLSATQPAAEKPAPAAPKQQVPAGMRAISVQVADSSGVLTDLQPGSKVDIQAIYSKPGDETALRTILERIEVLRTSGQPEASPGKPTLPVVTLITTPADADLLALADATARLRITLRNAEDNARPGRPSITVSSYMSGPRPQGK